MTLILSLLNPWYVVQVADRRLTFLQTGKLITDRTNKIILFKNRMAFGYTGLADLGGGTDGWLTNTFFEGPSDLDGAVENLESKAADVFNSVNLHPKHKIHAFGGVGWVDDDNDIVPAFVRVSNFYRNGERFDESFHFFTSDVYLCGPNQFRFFDTGARMTNDEKKWIKRRVQRAIRPEHTAWTCARILVESIRQVAKRNSSVGGDLLAVIIPKAAAKSDQIGAKTSVGPFELFSGYMPAREGTPSSGPDETPLFLDIPANTNQGSFRGPAVVIPDVFMTSGLQSLHHSSDETKDLDKFVPEVPPPGY